MNGKSVPISLEQLTRQILHTVLEAGVMVDAQIYSSVYSPLFSCVISILGVCLLVFSLLLRVRRNNLGGCLLWNYRNVLIANMKPIINLMS